MRLTQRVTLGKHLKAVIYHPALFGGRYKAIPIEDAATSPRGSVVWRGVISRC